MMISVLQYGAIGIGLAVLAYTAGLLRQELRRPRPRPEGRNLILMFMAFSLVAFGIATYIEIKKQTTNLDIHKKFAAIDRIVGQLDADLGGKSLASIGNISDARLQKDLTYFENVLCVNVKELKVLLEDKGNSRCTLSKK